MSNLVIVKVIPAYRYATLRAAPRLNSTTYLLENNMAHTEHIPT